MPFITKRKFKLVSHTYWRSHTVIKIIIFEVLKAARIIFPVFFIFIIGLIGMKFVLFTSYLQFQKVEFRRSVLSKSMQKTKVLYFASNEIYKDTQAIEWKDDNKELLISGKYYEVLAVMKQTALYKVIVIEDIEEDELILSYDQFSEGAGNKFNEYWSVLFCMNFIAADVLNISAEYFDINCQFFEKHDLYASSYCLDLNKPPA